VSLLRRYFTSLFVFIRQEPPYVTTTKANPTSNNDFKGYIPDLLKKLANHSDCNCDFKLQIVKDGKYGVQGENMEWNGMIGEVLRGVRITRLLSIFECVQLQT